MSNIINYFLKIIALPHPKRNSFPTKFGTTRLTISDSKNQQDKEETLFF